MGRLLRTVLCRRRIPAPASFARLIVSALPLPFLAAALCTLPLAPALAVKASPPTAVCTGKCEACIECENDNGKCRCVKCGVDPACLGDGGLSWEFTEMLKAHNGLRARHGVPPLTWSASLAKGAQDWANACTPDPKDGNRFAHSPGAWRDGYGENLYWGTRATSNDAVNWWYDEIRNYDFKNPLVSFEAGNTDSKKETRHFTQVVWRGSTQLGCGANTCKGMHYWVCRYAPPGNFNAQNPGVLAENVPPPGGTQQTQSSGGVTPQSTVPQPQPAPPAGQPARGEWSAFATDQKGNWGYGSHWASEQVAQQFAIDGCGGSAIGCQVFWTTRDRCVSYAESRAGGFWYAAGGGGDEQQAKQNAIKFCQSGTAPPGSCTTPVAECR